MTPFNRKTIKPGDKVILAHAPSCPAKFKGMGHDGSVVVTYWHPVHEDWRDAIVRQRDLELPERQEEQQ